MKKFLALSVLSTVMTTTFVFASGYSTGDIKFTGTVNTASCSMDAVAALDLGDVSTRTLAAAGSSSQPAQTTIRFRDCSFESTEESKIAITVDSAAAADGNASLYKNQGTALNVGVELTFDGLKLSPAGTTIPERAVGAAGGNTTFVVIGKMVALSADVTPGSVDGTVGFTARYK